MRQSEIQPVSAGERLVLVDALRGFALLGILLVNIAGFSQPFQAFSLPIETAQPWPDLAATVLVTLFAEGKFYALFSLLFGLGFTIQIERARGSGWRARYSRRLLVLFAIGIVHGVFIWAGDILALYAIVGFVPMLFARAAPRTVLVWIAVIATIYVLTVTAGFGLMQSSVQTPGAAQTWEHDAIEDYAARRAAVAETYRVYATGSFAEITAQRIRDLAFLFKQEPAFAPNVLLYFLLGLYLGKRGVFDAPATHAALFRRWVTVGVLLGLPASASYTATRFAFDPLLPSWIDWWAFVTFLGGGLALSLAYVGGLSLLWLRPTARRKLALLAPVGRMALTNYLLQSLAGTFIFYSYGLGLYGRVSPAGGLAIAFAIYACQIPFSHWWLDRFRFGPAEWIWRSLTYGRLQPMRM